MIWSRRSSSSSKCMLCHKLPINHRGRTCPYQTPYSSFVFVFSISHCVVVTKYDATINLKFLQTRLLRLKTGFSQNAMLYRGGHNYTQFPVVHCESKSLAYFQITKFLSNSPQPVIVQKHYSNCSKKIKVDIILRWLMPYPSSFICYTCIKERTTDPRWLLSKRSSVVAL